MPAPRHKDIASTRNPAVARFHAAAAGELPDLLLVEGVRPVAEAIAAGLLPVEAAVSPKLRDDSLRQRLAAAAGTLLECSDEVLARMSALDTHQGVAVLFARRSWREQDLLGALPLVAVAAGVRDPGNLGALLRTAEAAGATGFVSLRGGADPFRDKAVRGAMGSLFRLPTLHGLDAPAVVDFARRHDLQLVVADGGGGLDHAAADYRRPTLLVLGAEAQGVPQALLAAAAARVRIDIAPPVESLNVAVAAGILLFEARRQRRRP